VFCGLFVAGLQLPVTRRTMDPARGLRCTVTRRQWTCAGPGLRCTVPTGRLAQSAKPRRRVGARRAAAHVSRFAARASRLRAGGRGRRRAAGCRVAVAAAVTATSQLRSRLATTLTAAPTPGREAIPRRSGVGQTRKRVCLRYCPKLRALIETEERRWWDLGSSSCRVTCSESRCSEASRITRASGLEQIFVGALRRTAGLQASICAYPRRVSPAHTGYAARLVTGLRPGHPRH